MSKFFLALIASVVLYFVVTKTLCVFMCVH
jgi:hypothetical protein